MRAATGGLLADLRSSTATAVLDHGVATSYDELVADATVVAGALRDRGAGPGTVVPIQSTPSRTAIVQIVGTLLTGAAFGPIDARVPARMAARMARLCGAPFILGATDHDAHGVRWLSPPALATADAGLRPLASSVPDDTTYVIFTSGSSGMPKGVVVPLDAVQSYLGWSMREYELEGGYGAPLFTSLGFDLTITSLLGPLTSGRRIAVYDSVRWTLHVATDPAGVDGASFMKLTPSQVNLLCDLLEEQGSRCLVPRLVVGGEAMYGQSVARWRQSFPEAAIVNEYGPTEATVGCCRYVVPTDLDSGAVPIGTPPEGVTLTVAPLGDTGSDGSEGELVISGAQVATGYLRDAGSGADLGVLDRFPVHDSVRRYRSGDRVSRAPDGTLTYLGRLGREVKVNGFRVNLVAIESLLNEHRRVMSAVVDQGPDGELRAVVVARAEDVTVADLLGHLREALPSYAVPPVVQVVPRPETTERGKMRVPQELA